MREEIKSIGIDIGIGVGVSKGDGGRKLGKGLGWAGRHEGVAAGFAGAGRIDAALQDPGEVAHAGLFEAGCGRLLC